MVLVFVFVYSIVWRSWHWHWHTTRLSLARRWRKHNSDRIARSSQSDLSCWSESTRFSRNRIDRECLGLLSLTTPSRQWSTGGQHFVLHQSGQSQGNDSLFFGGKSFGFFSTNIERCFRSLEREKRTNSRGEYEEDDVFSPEIVRWFSLVLVTSSAILSPMMCRNRRRSKNCPFLCSTIWSEAKAGRFLSQSSVSMFSERRMF